MSQNYLLLLLLLSHLFSFSIWRSDVASNSPALSWAPVWVSVCLWAKLKDPSDNGQPERSTRRSSSPWRTSAKTWKQRARDDEMQSNWRSTADWLHHRCLLLTSVLVCPQRRQPALSSSQSKQKTIKITTLNNVKIYKRRKGESAALPLPACSAPH